MSSTAIDEADGLTLIAARPQRAPVRYSRRWALILVACDMSMFLLSAVLAGFVVIRHWEAALDLPRVLLSVLVFIATWLAIFHRVGLYQRSFALSVRDEFYYTVAALCIGIAPQLLLFTIIPSISSSRKVLLLSLAFSIVTVGGLRAMAHVYRIAEAKRRPRRIAIVGRRDRIAAASESLNIVEGTQLLQLPIEDVDATVDQINLTRDANLDWIPWFRSARDWRCDTLVLTEMLPPHVMPHILEVAARWQIKVAFAPPRFRAQAYALSFETDGQQALIIPQQLRACRPSARMVKRFFDIAVASIALLLVSPIMVLAALALWLESGRPIFFRQQRVGLNGAVFDVLKFRSMRHDAEAQTGPVWARRGDPRVTRVGAFLRRTSIDELPQFINVLRGEMSVVGPRPERPVFVETFRAKLPRYDERHLVRPGITGWSQVHMKRVLETSQAGEKLSHDLFYIENWGLFMDLSVIFKTAIEFLFHSAG